jgi:hypothetical protein
MCQVLTQALAQNVTFCRPAIRKLVSSRSIQTKGDQIMNKHLKHALAAFALTAIIASTLTAHADTGVTPNNKPAWLPGVDLRQVSVRPAGPEADPYYQHHAALVQASKKQWLAGVDLRQVAVRGSGPEADPYLQHAPAR